MEEELEVLTQDKCLIFSNFSRQRGCLLKGDTYWRVPNQGFMVHLNLTSRSDIKQIKAVGWISLVNLQVTFY